MVCTIHYSERLGGRLKRSLKVKNTVLVLLVGFMPLKSFAVDEQGYAEVPTAFDRALPASGYALLPGFPPTRLVKENSGDPDLQALALIPDQKLRAEIESKTFTSLQLSDLAIKTRDVYSEDGIIHFPFAISLKHTQGPNRFTNLNQGTIDCLGDILVHVDGKQLQVEVNKFYDSQPLDRLGRRMGYNQEINLAFAKSIIEPELEYWFNIDTEHIRTLLKMTAPLVARP